MTAIDTKRNKRVKKALWVIDLKKGILQQDDQVTDHSNGKKSS